MPKPKQRLEKNIQDDIKAYLIANQFLAWRNNQGAMIAEHKGRTRKIKFSTMPGISDLQAVREGRAVFIEVKRSSKEEPTEDQKIFLQAVRRYGGIAFVASSIEDVYGNLNEYFSMLLPIDYYNQLALQPKLKTAGQEKPARRSK